MPNPANQNNTLTDRQNPIKWLYYVGMSMFPTLRNLDILSISMVERKDIRRGDIVVFKSPISGRMISHRVIAIEHDGLRTGGDNMTARDLALVRYDSIVGRIEYLDRGLKSLPVRNGYSGLLRHYLIRLRKNITNLPKLRSSIRPLTNWLFKPKPAKSELTNNGEIRTFLFNHPKGTVARLFLGDRVIGRTTNGLASWEIDPEYRHFVDLSTIRAPQTFSANGNGSLARKIEVSQE